MHALLQGLQRNPKMVPPPERTVHTPLRNLSKDLKSIGTRAADAMSAFWGIPDICGQPAGMARSRMTLTGLERPAFAAMHGPDLLYFAPDPCLG
jgi:hypothetical protein